MFKFNVQKYALLCLRLAAKCRGLAADVPEPDLRVHFLRTRADEAAGGGSGIRTHDTVSRIHAFQACAFSHSATPPVNVECPQYSEAASSDNPRVEA